MTRFVSRRSHKKKHIKTEKKKLFSSSSVVLFLGRFSSVSFRVGRSPRGQEQTMALVCVPFVSRTRKIIRKTDDETTRNEKNE